MKVCLNCGIQFDGYGRRGKYCSEKCYFISRWGETPANKCLYCGKDITHTGKRSQKFCSHQCHSIYRKDKELTPQWRSHISQAQKSRGWTPKRQSQIEEAGKHRKYGKEMRDKIRVKRMVQKPQPHTNTTIEIILQDALRALDISFETHQSLLGVCIPDIIIPESRIAIFADGDYWHSLPKTYKRDKRQNTLLLKQGWLPMRFSEHSIRADASWCANEIKHLLLTPVPRQLGIFYT